MKTNRKVLFLFIALAALCLVAAVQAQTNDDGNTPASRQQLINGALGKLSANDTNYMNIIAALPDPAAVLSAPPGDHWLDHVSGQLGAGVLLKAPSLKTAVIAFDVSYEWNHLTLGVGGLVGLRNRILGQASVGLRDSFELTIPLINKQLTVTPFVLDGAGYSSGSSGGQLKGLATGSYHGVINYFSSGVDIRIANLWGWNFGGGAALVYAGIDQYIVVGGSFNHAIGLLKH